MRAERTKLLGGAAALLLVFLGSCVLVDGSTGWFPVLGNLVSAARMRSYAAQVYPELTPEGPWARYDPEDGGYFLAFALKTGGGRRNLYYDLGSKLVTDERRRTVLREELGIAEHPQVNGQRAYWDARWDPSEPDTPVVEIRIDFGDRNSAPVPEEAAMREAMADQAWRSMRTYPPGPRFTASPSTTAMRRRRTNAADLCGTPLLWSCRMVRR